MKIGETWQRIKGSQEFFNATEIGDKVIIAEITDLRIYYNLLNKEKNSIDDELLSMYRPIFISHFKKVYE